MRIAIIGQQDFGKTVLDQFLARGDTVAAVFCAPEKPGSKPDALRVAAQAAGLPVHQFESLRASEAIAAMQAAQADLGIMAFVLQFVPQELVTVPRHGTIQYHPSLLPKYRGPSSINWPIICGEAETGLSIFRPTDGLDEGVVILQKRTPISPDDTLGTVYFDRLFPLGVSALLEAADLVLAGRHTETVQDETQASYQGWCRNAESQIQWASPAQQVYNLIRGCNPAPGAWTLHNGSKLFLYDARLEPVRTFGAVQGKPGEVVACGSGTLVISTQGGRIHVTKAKLGEGKKANADTLGIAVGAVLGAVPR